MPAAARLHQVYALHVGDKGTTRSQFLYRVDSNEALTISFYFWVVLGGPEPVVFDVAFNAGQARERGLHAYWERAPLLQALDLRPEEIKTVVLSHLHWDHLAGYELFPNATFIVQRSEVAFWRDRAPRQELIMASANRKALAALLDLEAAKRVRLLDGPEQLWPGLEIIPVGGHTPGLQILAATTATGTVVLASDALHFYENYELRRPVQVTMDFPGALEAYDTIEKIASKGMVVAGHDAQTQTRFTPVAEHVFRIG